MQLPAFNSSLVRGLKTLAAAALLATVAKAQITLNSVDRGRYSEFGTHILSDHDSYFTGQALFGTEFRSFLVFDTSAITTPVTAATLRLYLPQGSFFSFSSTETLRIYDVSTSVASLTGSQLTATSIFNDLGSGTQFGSATLRESNEGSFINIALNANFLSYINGSAPDIFALGGALGSISGFLDQYAFAFSNTGNPADGRTQLLLTTAPSQGNVAVPEPSTYGLIGAGALLGAVALRRRFTARKS